MEPIIKPADKDHDRAYVIEDSPDHLRVLCAKLCELGYGVVPYDGFGNVDDVSPELVFSWLKQELNKHHASGSSTVFLDLAWMSRHDRTEIKDAEQWPTKYFDLLQRFLSLVLCPSGDILRLHSDNWTDGLTLLQDLRLWEGKPFTDVYNFSIVAVSTFGLPSVRELALHLGADWTIQKFPCLRQLYPSPPERSLDELQATFQSELQQKLLQLYCHLTSADEPAFYFKPHEDHRFLKDVHLDLQLDPEKPIPWAGAAKTEMLDAINLLEHRRLGATAEQKLPPSLCLDRELLGEHLRVFSTWACRERPFLLHCTHRLSKNADAPAQLRYLKEHLVGASLTACFHSIVNCVYAAKNSSSIVCIRGRPGTGKTYVADVLSPLTALPREVCDCYGLSPEEASKKLFGVQLPAGGVQKGDVDKANGGWLILENVHLWHRGAQAKLVSFLNTRRYSRSGGPTSQEECHARIAVTCTDDHSDMDSRLESVLAGQHAETIRLATLRRRQEDIPELVDYFCAAGKPPGFQCRFTVSEDTKNELKKQYWTKANVKMLREVLHEAMDRRAGLMKTDPGASFALPKDDLMVVYREHRN